jgi:hypothetical protein
MLRRAGFRNLPRLDDQSPRHHDGRAASVDMWLAQLCRDMDDLTELAKEVADGGETGTSSTGERVRPAARAPLVGLLSRRDGKA